MNTIPDTLSVEEAAEVMRIGADAMRELIVSGEMPALSLNKKHWVLLREDVLDFVRTRARQQQEDRRNRIAAVAPPQPLPPPEEPTAPRGRGAPRRARPQLAATRA